MGDIKTIYKLQDVNYHQITSEASLELSKNNNLTKTFLLGIFWTVGSDAYNLLWNDLIPKSIKFGG